MGVYIKGMEMPKHCYDCIFYLNRYDEDGEWLPSICVTTQLISEAGCTLNRASYCPLVEIPEPHGRLIDADALLDKLRPRGIQEDFWKESSSYNDIANAPTIIEGNEHDE